MEADLHLYSYLKFITFLPKPSPVFWESLERAVWSKQGSLAQLSWSAALHRHQNHCKLLSCMGVYPLLCCHLSFHKFASIYPPFVFSLTHTPQHYQYYFWGLFVKESERKKRKKKILFYIFICFRSWKLRKKGMLDLSLTHFAFSQNSLDATLWRFPSFGDCVFPLPQEPGSELFALEGCFWLRGVVLPRTPELLLLRMSKLKNQKHCECQKYYFPCDSLMRLQLMVIKKFPTLWKRRGLC